MCESANGNTIWEFKLIQHRKKHTLNTFVKKKKKIKLSKIKSMALNAECGCYADSVYRTIEGICLAFNSLARTFRSLSHCLVQTKSRHNLPSCLQLMLIRYLLGLVSIGL